MRRTGAQPSPGTPHTFNALVDGSIHIFFICDQNAGDGLADDVRGIIIMNQFQLQPIVRQVIAAGKQQRRTDTADPVQADLLHFIRNPEDFFGLIDGVRTFSAYFRSLRPFSVRVI